MPVHWHRRDLRPADNVGLAEAAGAATADDPVAPPFVLDAAVLAHAWPPRVAFLLDALGALRSWYRERRGDLLVARGDPREVVPEVAAVLDAQPYFRVFNPQTQGERHDPDAEYIRRYVPELRDVEPDVIHDWTALSATQRKQAAPDYPAPIVDHAERREQAIGAFERARGEE